MPSKSPNFSDSVLQIPDPMPTYEYECSKCKKNFDAFQSMKDAAYATCPKEKCRMKTWGRGKVKRLLGAGAGLIFKGSGFYITDYRSEGYKSAAKSDSSSPSSSSSGSETTSSPAKSEGTKAESAEPKKSPPKKS
jgi:putative FmdB family regulatory protein